MPNRHAFGNRKNLCPFLHFGFGVSEKEEGKKKKKKKKATVYLHYDFVLSNFMLQYFVRSSSFATGSCIVDWLIRKGISRTYALSDQIPGD